MVVSCDSNIIVYANDISDPEKHARAEGLLVRLLSKNSCLFAGQTLSEFMNVAIRKRRVSLPVAREVLGIAERQADIIEQTTDDRLAASILAESRKIQFYDALLCCTLARVGVTTLLSEDMADGEDYGGVTVLSPFNPADAARIEAAFQ